MRLGRFVRRQPPQALLPDFIATNFDLSTTYSCLPSSSYSDSEKNDAPTEDAPMSTHLDSDEEAQQSSDTQIAAITRIRTIFYWVVLGMAVTMFVFFTVTVFSCRAFHYEHSWIPENNFHYGYRGIMNNVTGECTDWEENFSEYWSSRMEILYYMGIGGVLLSLIAVGIWILEGTYGIHNYKQMMAMRTDEATEIISKRKCCFCFMIPTIFASVLGAFGFLAFVTVMGQCGNIPPLDPGGLGCNFSVWSSLGMFASIASCLMGCSVCCCYRRNRD